MHSVISDATELRVDGNVQSIDALVRRRPLTKNRAFYVPAQRVLTVVNGWPQPFQSYGLQDPYVVREFSEQFRLLMDKEYSRGGSLFPRTNRLKKAYRDLLSEHLFAGFELSIDVHGARRRLLLKDETGKTAIPFMTWSAGQREFVPLLMGLYWLLPASKVPRRDSIEWVILEELEAGLHPAAITAVLLIVLDLMWRGYKVCLSTHSPQVLDMVWAIRNLKEADASADRILELFGARKTPQMREVAGSILGKDIAVYHFDTSTGVAKNISRLDPMSADDIESGWGGLTEYSSRMAEVIANVVAEQPS